jgi:hypothetical protein
MSVPSPVDRRFSILTGGYGYGLIEKVWTAVARRTDFELHHVPDPSLFRSKEPARPRFDSSSLLYLFDAPQKNLPRADIDFLTELEQSTGPTIHNVILGDARLSHLPYTDALDYVSAAAHRFRQILLQVKPDVVLSGYDGYQSTLLMLVCRSLKVPWYALTYLPIPKGMMGFSPLNVCNGVRAFGPVDNERIALEAERTLDGFERKMLATHVPPSENSISNIFRFLPLRLANATSSLKSVLNGTRDPYTRRSLLDSAKDYLRRRWNYFTNKSLPMVAHPPGRSFAFFGFHMQPEMGIDVWAPFYSNQLHVIACIARALPPSHTLLVKLHRIDCDNWSTSQLRSLLNLPGVQIVSPHADTYEFLRRASLVFSIQGTIALESALLKKQVIAFGETMYEVMPNVARVINLIELPALVRSRLRAPEPTRTEIRAGLEVLLARFRSGLYNNWELDPADSQLDDFCEHLVHLKAYLRLQQDERQSTPEPR